MSSLDPPFENVHPGKSTRSKDDRSWSGLIVLGGSPRVAQWLADGCEVSMLGPPFEGANPANPTKSEAGCPQSG